MLTRAKVQEEITALAEEVRAEAHRRGAAMPTGEDLAEVIEALTPTLEQIRAAQAPGEGQDERLWELLSPREILPAAEPLRAAYEQALGQGLAQNRPAYLQSLQELRAALQTLLEERGEQWALHWDRIARKHDLYRGALHSVKGTLGQPKPIPRACTPESAAKARGWGLVVLAARALHVARVELSEWREWVTGGAATRREQLLGELSSPALSPEDPAAVWARELAQHTLPEEEEAELVSRGIVTAEQLAAVKALPPIPPQSEA